MRRKVTILAVSLVSILNLFVMYLPASAGDVTVQQTCNVVVTFKATVPNSVEQGKQANVTNITVQPASTYGFNVTSSVFAMSATNTSSSSYNQDFVTTNPHPTTGAQTYVGIYPNWSLNATGPVGSSIVLTLVSTKTVVQGYGTVNCSFSAVLATIPITAPAPPSPPPSPSPSSSPSPSPSSSPSHSPNPSASPGPSSSPSGGATNSGSSSSSGSNTTSPGSNTKTGSQPGSSTSNTTGSSSQSSDQSVTVVPLNVEVKDSKGVVVKGATVNLDGSQKLTTGADGKAIFSNVLTGSHSILVTYKGQKVNSNVTITTQNVGGTLVITLPAIPLPWAYIAGAVASVATVAGTTFGLLMFGRKRKADELEAIKAAKPAISIPGIMAGPVVEDLSSSSIVHTPAVSMFESQAPVMKPAPWAPVAFATPESYPVAPSLASVSPTLVSPAPASAPKPSIVLRTPPSIANPMATIPVKKVGIPQVTTQPPITVTAVAPPSPPVSAAVPIIVVPSVPAPVAPIGSVVAPVLAPTQIPTSAPITVTAPVSAKVPPTAKTIPAIQSDNVPVATTNKGSDVPRDVTDSDPTEIVSAPISHF